MQAQFERPRDAGLVIAIVIWFGAIGICIAVALGYLAFTNTDAIFYCDELWADAQGSPPDPKARDDYELLCID